MPPDNLPTVKFMQCRPKKPWNGPLTSKVVIRHVRLEATLDTGAFISAVHPSTLMKCGIEYDAVMSMTADSIIEPACRPWASPIVIVERPSTEQRFCIDF